MSARLCFVFPSRQRTVRFFQTLDNIRAMSNSDNYFVWAKLDNDDISMNRPEIIKHLADNYKEVTVKWGLSEGKVSAINRSMEDLPECDIIILQSDDIVWDVKGFDDIIREAFTTHSPDYSHAIHFPDDHGKQKTIIVSILGISLYKELGCLYQPDFESVYADDFFTEQVRRMGKYVYVGIRLYTHKHPMWNLEKWDSQYRHTERPEVYKKDRETFQRLRKEFFGL